MQTVSDLEASSTIGRTFTGRTSDLMDLSAHWHKSGLRAPMARRLAEASGIEDRERFFIEGLLRDIGHLVLYQALPHRAQSALIEAENLIAPLAEMEQANIGCAFTEVGAELIRSWGMPSQIERAIRHQLSPNEAGEFTLQASIVHLAGAAIDHAELAQASQPPPFHKVALAWIDPLAKAARRHPVTRHQITRLETSRNTQTEIIRIMPA
jgi:HD-like signal output (HDOD) protein